jgi:predicted lipoprotein with Yx(FWY)xxD motif
MKEIKRGLRLSVVAAAIGGAALLSACSSGQTGDASGSAATSAATSAVGPQYAQQSPAGQVQNSQSAANVESVKLSATESSVGTIVTDGAGRSLYRFDKDTAKPSVSNCSGKCATTWPPVTVAKGSSIQLQGVQQSDIGTVQRSDGSWQVTISGWPIYRYALDQVAGDVKGQGVGGTWFAVTPTGKKASGVSTANGAIGSGNTNGGSSTSGSTGSYGSGGYGSSDTGSSDYSSGSGY